MENCPKKFLKPRSCEYFTEILQTSPISGPFSVAPTQASWNTAVDKPSTIRREVSEFGTGKLELYPGNIGNPQPVTQFPGPFKHPKHAHKNLMI